MRRGFPYVTSITCKKEGKIYVEGRILRLVTMSRDTQAEDGRQMLETWSNET
jgi:hypothetical protein